MKKTKTIITSEEWTPLRELVAFFGARELLWTFVIRSINTRYRQMALGRFWSFLEPLGQLAMMSVVFGLLIRIDTGGYPFAIFVFSALIPWQIFARVTNTTTGSMVENIGIISKIYFPRLILPVSAAILELLDCLILLVVLVLVATFFGYPPNPKMLLFPFLLVYLSIPALGLGLFFTTLSVKYRDIRPAVGLCIQAGFYATPIFYPVTLVPSALRPFYELNPVYWGVELSRWMILEKPMESELNWSFLGAQILVLSWIVIGFSTFTLHHRKIIDEQ